jgi:hypothetical protein
MPLPWAKGDWSAMVTVRPDLALVVREVLREDRDEQLPPLLAQLQHVFLAAKIGDEESIRIVKLIDEMVSLEEEQPIRALTDPPEREEYAGFVRVFLELERRVLG